MGATDTLWSCVCEHDDRQHTIPSPFACTMFGCNCDHFRWDFLDWTDPVLLDLILEKATSA